MMKHRIIFIGMLLTVMWSSSPDFIGEVLHYSAGFRFLPAGNATLSMQSDSLENEMVYLLTSTVRTNSFLSNFYKIRDDIKSWLSTDNLSLKKTVQTIREGRYRKNHEARILGDSLAISEKRITRLPGAVYDPIAFVYFLRLQKLLEGNQYSFFSYSRKKITKIIVDVTGRETIQVPAGTFTCYKIEPVAGNGKSILKNNGVMRVWLTDDSLHIPIKIEQNTSIGTMVMKLKKITHLIP